MERWKAVPGYEGRYEVSDLGFVRSLPNSRFKTTRLLKQHVSKRGYLTVRLTSHDGTRWTQHTKTVHPIVLEAFEGAAPADRPWALHRDGDRLNPMLDNLYWGTPAENTEDRRRHGNHSIGVRNPVAVLSEDDVREIKRLLGSRERGAVARVSRETGHNYRTILAIAQNRTWTHI